MNKDIYSQYDALCNYLNLGKERSKDLILLEVTGEEIQKMIELAPDFWQGEESWNEMPTQNEFLAFLKEHPDFRAEVNLVNPNLREDYRFNVDAVKAINTPKNTKILRDWIDSLDYIAEPSEFFEYKGDIRAWWD